MNKLITILCIIFASSVHAAVTLNISNNPSVIVGDTHNLDAADVALQLSFSNLNLFPDLDLNVLEDIDLSTSAFGPTTGNLRMDAPEVNFYGNILFGLGQLTVWAENFFLSNSINTTGVVWDGGVSGVLNVGENSSLVLTGGPLGASLTVASNSILELIGSNFEIDTGTGFVSADAGALTTDSGTLRGTLFSGENFEIEFDHNMLASSIVLTAVPLPATIWFLLSAIGGLLSLSRQRRYTPQ